MPHGTHVLGDVSVAIVQVAAAESRVVQARRTLLAFEFVVTALHGQVSALATAPVATEAKVPQVVMMAATSVITERSPYIVRTSFSVPQTTVPLATWAAENGIKTVVSVVSCKNVVARIR